MRYLLVTFCAILTLSCGPYKSDFDNYKSARILLDITVGTINEAAATCQLQMNLTKFNKKYEAGAIKCCSDLKKEAEQLPAKVDEFRKACLVCYSKERCEDEINVIKNQ
jgi:hypothetical protein